MAYLLLEVQNLTTLTSSANQKETARYHCIHTDGSSFSTQISSSKIFPDSTKSLWKQVTPRVVRANGHCELLLKILSQLSGARPVSYMAPSQAEIKLALLNFRMFLRVCQLKSSPKFIFIYTHIYMHNKPKHFVPKRFISKTKTLVSVVFLKMGQGCLTVQSEVCYSE